MSQGSYSRKQIVRTIEQLSYDLRRRYDTTYSQNMSQALIVLYTMSVLLASLMFYISIENCCSGCTKTRHFDI